jgi:paraquat-inducible protein B
MKRKANPALIGFFVLGGLILLIVTLGVLGSYRLLKRTETFILYFDSSVNGLSIGAPVKFRGVPIGRVTDIYVRYNQDEFSTRIPVFIEIDTRRLTERLGVNFDISDDTVLFRQVNAGLRAQLQMDGYISGLLFIELDYYPDSGNPQYAQQIPKMREIPTLQSTFSEFGKIGQNIAGQLNQLDLVRLNRELIQSVARFDQTLAAIDAASLNQNLNATLESVRALVESEELKLGIAEFTAAMTALKTGVTHLERSIIPVVEKAESTLASLEETSNIARRTLDPNRETLTRLQESLAEISRSAQSLRQLTDLLERNPRALISGKENTPEQ